jgi:hypothetical protein
VQTALNLRRWAELLADRELARVEGRIETDRHGHIIMSPPPAPRHGSFQLEIGHLLRTLMPSGRVLTECPISTADGVKAADVAWASPEDRDFVPSFQSKSNCVEASGLPQEGLPTALRPPLVCCLERWRRLPQVIQNTAGRMNLPVPEEP